MKGKGFIQSAASPPALTVVDFVGQCVIIALVI